MNKTVVAIFDDIIVARQVVEDLVNANFARGSISLITNDANNQYGHYLDKGYAPREDAVTSSEGAGFGAVVGALTGVLVGLAALMIPGIGLAVVAGPVVAGLTGAVAGALTGGIVGALVKSGVPEDEAPYYAEGIRRGGTLISIETSDSLRAEDIMHRHGSINIHERSNLWRQDGWKGFNVETVENENTGNKPLPEVIATIATNTTNTGVTPISRDVSPMTVVPVVPMFEATQAASEDTAQSLPVTVAGTINDMTIPVSPIPDGIATEPVLVMVEEETQFEDEDMAK